MSPDDPRHGTPAGYNAHKRAGQTACDPCKRGIAGYQARISWERENGNPRRVAATGTQRRIQALMALGWSAEDVARELGWAHKRAVHRLRFVTFVYRSTHEQVAAAYERLSGTPGPNENAKRRALAAGYAPPLAWDDIDNPDEKPKGHDICRAPDCARAIAYSGLCLPHYRAERKAA